LVLGRRVAHLVEKVLADEDVAEDALRASKLGRRQNFSTVQHKHRATGCVTMTVGGFKLLRAERKKTKTYLIIAIEDEHR
jgi:hypothetical protein